MNSVGPGSTSDAISAAVSKAQDELDEAARLACQESGSSSPPGTPPGTPPGQAQTLQLQIEPLKSRLVSSAIAEVTASCSTWICQWHIPGSACLQYSQTTLQQSWQMHHWCQLPVERSTPVLAQAMLAAHAVLQCKLQGHAAAALQALSSSSWPAAVVSTAAAIAADVALATCTQRLIDEVMPAWPARVNRPWPETRRQ